MRLLTRPEKTKVVLILSGLCVLRLREWNSEQSTSTIQSLINTDHDQSLIFVSFIFTFTS